jgi:D-alanyl-D-alanine carboxypeptidase
VLAGMVVEKVTGRTYASEVERRIIRPLGMRDTSLPGRSTRVPGPNGRAYSRLFANGGSGRGGSAGPGWGGHAPVHEVTALDPSFAGASGEMVSSTRDLLRFFRALLAGRMLPPRQSAEMRTTVPTGDGSRYGLGLTERRLSCGTRVWVHIGDIHGSRSIASGTPHGGHIAVFNVNADWTDGRDELLEAEYCRS